MSDQIEELIREIAAKHGIAVSRNDPILVLQTINNRLLQDSAKAQQAMLDQYKEELAAIAQQWSHDAKAKAERILTASLTASKEAMTKLMQEEAKYTAQAVRADVEAALGKVTAAIRQARRLVLWNLATAGLTLVATGVALGVTWPSLLHRIMG